MRRVDFELNMSGLRELMKSSSMQAQLLSAARTVASAAGPGYEASVHVPGVVPIATAYPASQEAVDDAYENLTLMKALGASGLPQRKG